MQQAVQTAARPVSDRIAALMRLARQDDPAARGTLYNSVADLFIARHDRLSPEERDLARQVLAILTQKVETEIRRALALRLAGRPDAPLDLVLMLANDTVRVAEPVLIHSPVLQDSDLVLIIRQASSAHQNIVARRPYIGPTVSEALLEHANDNTLGTLLANATASIPAEAMRTLVNRSALNPALQTPLTQRADLPQDVIATLYKMVSATLKAHIESRYVLPASVLEADLTAALQDAARDQASPAARQATLIIDKLERAKTLGPGFLMKALSEGQHELFLEGFGRLLKARSETMQQVLAASDFRPLALCTRALGIDRSAFLAVHNALRAEPLAGLDQHQKAILDEIFLRLTPQGARAKLVRLGISAG
jgi:uncharacterized protein (DUF2336 family)